ncbi:ATP-binding protein [Actinacidiphila rubida]|uniref:Histidine kinase-like ATPase domain-containing protein n=1 Tax=Actinacidiphila rubida TaxID=310780 RepID=A0A1H8SJY0_9ACTN|nr:ATP-binding protein [Actinacidiphila rubida]SEO79309.1 Histidine kinase-like ATPase domain-containing protein [Actinacidiphila rubida]
MTRVATVGRWRAESRSFHLTLSLEPGAVTAARLDVTEVLTEFGFDRRSAFSDAVLLVVSELVSNVLRHAGGRSATAEVTITIHGSRLMVDVADQDPRLPDLSPPSLGAGLRTVVELAEQYSGNLRAQALPDGAGKSMRVRFQTPSTR